MGKDYSNMVNEISKVVEIMEEAFDTDICDLTTSDLYSMALQLVILKNSETEIEPSKITVTKNEDIALGQRIKDIRASLRMNQKDFSNKIGSTVSALSNWENGRNKPNDIMSREIAKLGNISIDELLGGN